MAEGAEVRLLARPESGAPQWSADVEAHVTRAITDFSDARALARNPLLDGADVVIHAAGVTRARSSSAFHVGNVLPTQALLGALAMRGERPRFVLVSSQAATGPAPSLAQPVTERDAARPIEPYGVSKRRAEELVSASSLPWTIVRPASVYGPRDTDFLALFRTATMGLMVYPGTHDSWLSLIHVRDCVAGILAAARHPRAEGHTFHLANRVPVRWTEVYAAVAQAVERRPRELALPGWLLRAAAPLVERLTIGDRPPLLTRQKARLAQPRFWICSSDAAASVLGVEPRTTLPGGMRETYLWYSEHGWLRRRGGSAGRLRPVA